MAAFIVLEGGDASGKSTQARQLADRLRSRGRDVVETFEPGATQAGVAIHALLLDGDGPIDPMTEALLLAADRAQEVADIIRPALARGADVVSDRFVPSSLAYQGVGRGLGVEQVEKLNGWATGGLEPDLIVVLDVDDAVAASRRDAPGDRLERAGADSTPRCARPTAHSVRIGAGSCSTGTTTWRSCRNASGRSSGSASASSHRGVFAISEPQPGARRPRGEGSR